MMKTYTTMLLVLLVLTLQSPAQESTTNQYYGSSAVILDGNPAGLTEQFMVSGIAGSITNVQMSLDISGGFNGDLYAYLVSPLGQMAVLLNRPGVDGSNLFGYGDAGINITLDGTATGNVHFYQAGNNYTLVGGQLTGTWAADGRNIDPQSAGSVFGSATSVAGLNLYYGFNGGDVNGTWTLFIADMSAGGGSPVLNQAALTIITVPEPQAGILLAGGFAMFLLFCKRRRS